MKDQIETPGNAEELKPAPAPTPVTNSSQPPVAEEKIAQDEIKPSAEQSAKPDVGGAEKRPGFFARALKWLFNPETKLGRFVRPALRWTGFAIALFALGLLAGYILLTQPAQRQLEDSQSHLKTAEGQITELQNNLATTEQDRNQLQDLVQSLRDAHDQDSQHLLLLQIQVSARQAQVALANRDGATALLDLKMAQNQLTTLLPVIRKQAPDLATSLDTRISLVLSELTRDPQKSVTELVFLSDNLNQLEKLLFPTP
jgi:hypothetical protein